MPNIIEITDFAAPELDIYARLTETVMNRTRAFLLLKAPR